MKKIISTVIAATIGFSSLAACNPLPINNYARGNAPAGYEWGTPCTDLSISVHGYEPGTVFFVGLDGEPPYHMTMAEGIHNFGVAVFDHYGIYIRNPEGVVLANTFVRVSC